MSKIKIKNFGPIKAGFLDNDGWIDIKKVTLFIGNQGSGKSTIVKLISTFSWIEKALTRGDYNKKDLERKDAIIPYLEYHRIHNYVRYFKSKNSDVNDTSEIDYIGEAYSIIYRNRKLKITKNRGINYPLPQIMYVPAERNFLSSIEDLKSQRIFSKPLFELLTELHEAKKEIEGGLKLPINNTDLQYDKFRDTLYVKGTDYTVSLSESSSGFQSIVPLFLVSWFLANAVRKSAESKEPMSSDELERFREGLNAILDNDSLTGDQKRVALSELSAIFNKTAFINIVEEPEQNLFPTSQWQVLKSLLEYNNMSDGNKLIMTTHSPYIINYLTVAVKAHSLKNKVQNEKLNRKLNGIVPSCSTVDSNDLVIYELYEEQGQIKILKPYNNLPSDENQLNEILGETNELFAQLLEIQQSL